MMYLQQNRREMILNNLRVLAGATLVAGCWPFIIEDIFVG